MVNLMRKYQQSIMLLVTAVVIVSFVWFYNGQKTQRSAVDRVAGIYGQNVTMAQFQREYRKFSLGQFLGMFDLLGALVGNEARTESQAVDNYVFNTIILRHEAEALGIAPSDKEVANAIMQMPSFQTNAAFDNAKYKDFLARILPRGLTNEQVEEIVRDDLRLQKIKRLLSATMGATPTEVRSLFERQHQKSEVSFVRFKTEDFSKAVQISDADVKKLFEERKAGLNSEELRKVKLVAFTLEKQEKPLAGKERATALSKLGERAQEFTVAMTEKDAKFDAVAEKFGVKVTQTESFAADALPMELGVSPQVGQAVFHLTTEQPHSDVLTGDTGYFVVELAGITPARPLTLEEAKPKLETQLRDERTRESLELKVNGTRAKLAESLKAGKPFAEAVEAAGLKAESLPAFSMAEPPKSEAPEVRMVAGRSFDLKEGELSEPIPLSDGSALVCVQKRLPIDEQKLEQEKTGLSENIIRGKQSAALELWIKERRGLAKVDSGRS